MTPKQRFITALDRGIPDRLPVTTHHIMPYFLKEYMGGIDNDTFFERMGMDPIHWLVPMRPNTARGERFGEGASAGFIISDDFEIRAEPLPDPNRRGARYTVHTPKGDLTAVVETNDQTSWQLEHPIKEKRDIDLLGEFFTAPLCDVDAVCAEAESYGERGLLRGHIPGFEFFGQPGTWQDAACMVGVERLIMETFEDPEWVHALLKILQRRKLAFVASLEGAPYDVLELGGGDASSTVISPAILEEFVLPYDGPIIEAAQARGQRIAYHTCGGMMPFLERIASMRPNAMETFTPRGMGGDVDLAEAKRRIGDQVCMIGGFNQGRFFWDCTPEETRAEVRRCFEAAGHGGGFILCPSDHFFDADPELVAAFADEGRKCVYETGNAA